MATIKPSPSQPPPCNETRCECGQLIAKVAEGGLELKCKRCKRIVLIPFSAIDGWSDTAAGVAS